MLVIEKSGLGGHAGVTERLDNFPGFPDGIAGAEFYQRVESLQADIGNAQRWSWLVVAAAMLVIDLLLAGFVRRASGCCPRTRG